MQPLETISLKMARYRFATARQQPHQIEPKAQAGWQELTLRVALDVGAELDDAVELLLVVGLEGELLGAQVLRLGSVHGLKGDLHLDRLERRVVRARHARNRRLGMSEQGDKRGIAQERAP